MNAKATVTTLRVLYRSVNGARYLAGGSAVKSYDVNPIPTGEGLEFKNMTAVKAFVKRQLSGLTSYYGVDVVNAAGEMIAYGRRNGYNSTGKGWNWYDVN